VATIECREVSPFIIEGNASEGCVLRVEHEGLASPGIEFARVVSVPCVEPLDQTPCPPAGGHLGRGTTGEGVEHERGEEVRERCGEARMGGEDFEEYRLAGEADDDAALTIKYRGARFVGRALDSVEMIDVGRSSRSPH
jgi:hypothetical protein